MEDRERVKIFKALASESRFKILRLVKEHPQCVNTIAARLGMTQPTVSQHLRLLKEAGLVGAEKRGIWMHYGMDAKAGERYGKFTSGIFGGRAERSRAVAGTLHCPPELLKKCRNKTADKRKP
jgi:ArsR family transcriptional regulator